MTWFLLALTRQHLLAAARPQACLDRFLRVRDRSRTQHPNYLLSFSHSIYGDLVDIGDLESGGSVMSEEVIRLDLPPIAEAVVDIECDMQPQFNLLSVEPAARAKFLTDYPEFKKRFVEQHRFQPRGDEPAEHTTFREIQALQFIRSDKTQLLQVRTTGYSFNRLTPYTSLDNYFPEIEKTWREFVEVASPIQVRAVRLRYINRFFLPLVDGKINFDEFLTVGPQLPDQTNLSFTGFVNQYSAVETETGAHAGVVLTAQPAADNQLPLIFDITVEEPAVGPVDNWPGIKQKIDALRLLKNRIFHYTLTPQCKKLFQRPPT